jgi:hypothetical protein
MPVPHKKQRRLQLLYVSLCLCVVLIKYCVLTLSQTKFINSYFVIKFIQKLKVPVYLGSREYLYSMIKKDELNFARLYVRN